MRNKLTFLLIVFSYASNAQFKIQPQIGLESSTTTINYNEVSIPSGMQFSPKLGLRAEYQIKKGHGVFAGISTSAPTVDFNFSALPAGAGTYNTSRENLQVRFEGGYQFSTKPISLSKPKAASQATSSRNFGYGDMGSRGSCIRKMSCGRQSAMKQCGKNSSRTVAKNSGSYLRIIPSAGFAFIPSQPSEIETKSPGSATTHTYKAGAWNTAFITGAGFEFGSNRQAKYIVSVNYLKGLGNMDTKTVNSVTNGKSVATSVSSNASAWSISLGVPISLSKKKPQPKYQMERIYHHEKIVEKYQYRGRCGQYK